LIESSPVTTQKSAGSYSSFKGRLLRLLLPLILLLQANASLLALRNTAFQDEALYLLAGREILLSWLGKVSYLEPYGLYFSGYPSFYPVIGGMLDFLGGLETARMFSLLSMLIVTACVYYTTVQFFDRRSALIAAFLFACEGSVLFIGRLATYDAFCLCLLALSVVLSLRASKAASARSCLAVGPLLILAIAAKYAGLLFVPSVLALLAWWSWKHGGLEGIFVRLGGALLSLAASGLIAFLVMDKQVLAGLSFTTVNRVSLAQVAPILVIQHIAVMEGVFFGLGILGLLLCGRQRLPSGLLLFGSALLAPLYHTYKGELVSLDKHLAFSMFFLAPLAGIAIASLVRLWQNRFVRLSWFPMLALCLVTFPLGLQQARTLYEGWSSSTQLTAFLRPKVQPGTAHYLAEDFDVLRYDLKNQTDIWQWSGLDYFVYTDKEQHNLSGGAAYKAAFQEGYFDLVELSYGFHAPLATQITQMMAASKQYDLIGKIPAHSSYGSGYFWIWSKHTTGLAQGSASCDQPQPAPGKISLAGLAYGPSHAGQDPTQGGFPSGEEIEADMGTLASLTHYIRTYTSVGPASEIVQAAQAAQVCVALGVGLNKDTAANAREIAGAEGLASNSAVRSIIVGNEVLQNGNLTEAQLRADIEQVRAKIGRSVPITTADTYAQWMEHPELAKAVDFITVHIYPFWQKVPIDAAIHTLNQEYTQLQKTFPGKQIVIGETGWPSTGPAYGAAVPSAANQVRYLRDFTSWAQAKGVHYFYFAAYDEDWKVHEEGVGSHWGIYQQDGKVKPALSAMLPEPEPSTVVQRAYRDVYVGGLIAGFGLGMQTSGGQLHWLSANNDGIVVNYPAHQQWGVMFISVGQPAPAGHRPSLDLSAYRSLVVDMRAAVDGQCVRIGIKDKNQPDDGSEVAVQRCLTTRWSTLTLPLRAFTGVDLKHLCVVFEVLFQGSSSATVEIRNVRYSPT